MTVQSTPSPLRRRIARRNRHLVARRGATAVLVALCALPIVAVLALAVDIGVFYRARRNQQNAADAAALAWAHERYSHPVTLVAGADARLATAAAAHGYTNGTNGTLITSQILSWGTSSSAIRVTIRDTVSTFFSGVLGKSRTVVAATAVATYDLATSTACVIALHPTASNAVRLTGDTQLNAPGCGMHVNSSANPALTRSGKSVITSPSVGVAGTVSQNGNGGIYPNPPVTGVLQAADPLTGITAIAPSPCLTGVDVDVKNGETRAYSPGLYCDAVNIKGTVAFAPGEYWFQRGLTITSQANVSGTGVTLINMAGANAGPFDIHAGADFNMSASLAPGPFRGILFYQQPSNTQTFIVRGHASAVIRGTIYVPGAKLDLAGNTDFTIEGALIASTIDATGGATIRIPTVTAGNSGYFAPKRVTLVD